MEIPTQGIREIHVEELRAPIMSGAGGPGGMNGGSDGDFTFHVQWLNSSDQARGKSPESL